MEAEPPPNEDARLAALYEYDILDTDADAEFDDFTLLAAQICGTPISLISLVDADRQWFKSNIGLEIPETPREQAFCAHALHQPGVLVVPNALEDVRFAGNPLVTGDPNIRFYAGAPLLTPEGHALGTLCVSDRVPRTLTPEQQAALQALSRQVVARLELRRQLRERETADRARATSENLKNAILQSALDCIITINQKGRVVEWNPAAERTFGFTREQAAGRELADLIVPARFQDAHRRGMVHYLATGEGPVLHQRIEIDARRSDGTEFPVELAITPILLETETLFTAYLRDISDRKHAEAALQSARAELETRVAQRTASLTQMQRQNALLLESAGEGIYGLDSNGITQFANPAAAQMLGYEVEELIGRPMHALLHHTYADGRPFPKQDCPIHHCLHDAETRRVDDEIFWRKDGTAINVEYISTPICEGDQIVGAVVTFQDITKRKRAEENILALNADLLHAYDATIEGWSRALDLRDHETEGHSRRVTEMTLRLALAAGIPESEMIHVRRGALLHDIGKMGVPDAVLLKPGPLGDDEWEIMRRHPALAKEMLAPAAFLRPALTIPYCHHEKWDGSGYPQGLRGEQIPLPARLFALVDVWDALSSDRPYRAAWPPERVKDHLYRLAGTHFDPDLVSVFLGLLDDAAFGTEMALRAA